MAVIYALVQMKIMMLKETIASLPLHSAARVGLNKKLLLYESIRVKLLRKL